MHAHWTIVGLTLGSLQAPLCLNCLVSIRNICSLVDQRCWLTLHTRNRQYSHYVVLHRLDPMFYHPNCAIEKPHQMAAGGGRVKSLHEFHTHTHTHTHTPRCLPITTNKLCPVSSHCNQELVQTHGSINSHFTTCQKIKHRHQYALERPHKSNNLRTLLINWFVRKLREPTKIILNIEVLHRWRCIVSYQLHKSLDTHPNCVSVYRRASLQVGAK